MPRLDGIYSGNTLMKIQIGMVLCSYDLFRSDDSFLFVNVNAFQLLLLMIACLPKEKKKELIHFMYPFSLEIHLNVCVLRDYFDFYY